MVMITADKTMELLDASMKADQGAKYREMMGKIMMTFTDAFRPEEDGFRSHMGASIIGGECPRSIWYSYRWASKENHEARLIRIFSTGHLMEPRIVAMLMACGITVYQQDANGNQYRISDCDEHLGGSGDGVLFGVPDLPQNMYCLAEFKTMGDAMFKKVVKVGMQLAKPEHYTQVQIYMHKMGLQATLYIAVNKNDDSIHMEIVFINADHAQQQIDKARRIIYMKTAPVGAANYPGAMVCKFCNHAKVCHTAAEPEQTCRSCKHSEPIANAQWQCNFAGQHVLPKTVQLVGCHQYQKLDSFN